MTLFASTLPGIRRVEHIMGMPIIADVRDDGVSASDLDPIFDWLSWVDATFSTFKPDSEICRLGRGELELQEAHPEVQWVLGRCEEIRVETLGYFDVHAAGAHSLDPSGLVKGWAVDRAADLLVGAGLRNYAISAGGDIRLSGRALPDPEWLVGIQHPLLKNKIATTLALSSGAVATSGAYERGEHVLDPHTGNPPAGVLSVTITGPDLATADAYATAAFAMGKAGPGWTARLRGYEAMTILTDERVLSTARFPGSERELQPSPASASTIT